ncbi:22579_t:CDS:2, partial [Racocetra persica]
DWVPGQCSVESICNYFCKNLSRMFYESDGSILVFVVDLVR